MNKFVIIQADTNDADYITGKSAITDEHIELMKPIIAALKVRRDNNKWCHNWETSSYGPWEGEPKDMYKGILTEEQIDFFNHYVPTGEDGIHTIESIEIVYEGEKLF